MPVFDLPKAAAYIIITATTAMIWSVLMWNIRVFVRTKIRGPFGWDNIHCTIATVLGVLNSSITILEAHYGLGRHTDDVPLPTGRHQHLLAWIAAQLYVLALCFANLSVCILILRITKHTNRAWLAHTIAVVTSAWAVVAFFLIVFMCRLPHPWITKPPSRCINIQYHSWIAIALVNALLDIANIVAAVFLLWRIRMPWRTRALVVTLFAMRLDVIPPTLMRLQYIKKALSGSDWSHDRISVVIITQIILHLSIMLVTLPCIKPYLKVFESGALQAPTIDLRLVSKPPGKQPRSDALGTLMRPRLTFKRRGLHDRPGSSSLTAPNTGKADYHDRAEAWPGQTCLNQTSFVTTVEHDPVAAREAERRWSKGSVSSKTITRKRSFSVCFHDVGDSINEAAAGPSCNGGLMRSSKALLTSRDAAELLITDRVEGEKQGSGTQRTT